MTLRDLFTSTVCLCLLPLALHAKPFTVIIDSGHGGSDPGATRYGFKEKRIALQVSQYLSELLKKDRRFRVILTRKDDQTITLKERAEIANQAKGDLFLSIHINASINKNVRGVEFYFQNQLPPDKESFYLAAKENDVDQTSKDKISDNLGTPPTSNKDIAAIIEDMTRNHRISNSEQLAHKLYKSWDGSTKKRRMSVRQAPFYLISNVNMPSSLIELGFITNRKDAKILSSPNKQAEMAENLYAGIIKFKELLDKQSY